MYANLSAKLVCNLLLILWMKLDNNVIYNRNKLTTRISNNFYCVSSHIHYYILIINLKVTNLSCSLLDYIFKTVQFCLKRKWLINQTWKGTEINVKVFKYNLCIFFIVICFSGKNYRYTSGLDAWLCLHMMDFNKRNRHLTLNGQWVQQHS